MQRLSLPAFGETNYTDHTESKTSRVLTLQNVSDDAFDRYLAYFAENGFCVHETRERDRHRFAALVKDSDGIFLNAYAGIRELTIVTERNSLYASHQDCAREQICTAQITQIELTDFGMSYVIRLSDGRFLVIDGGRDLEADREQLMRCLREQSVGEKPVIAAWILTHPHSDHFHCFIGVMERYRDALTVESVLLNFPEADDLVHYPKLTSDSSRFDYDTSGVVNIPLMYEQIAQSGATLYTTHTGQIYKIGGATLEILASMDDTIHVTQNINATSLVIRMELAGQIILWMTDASMEYARIPEKYGDHLRADILQVPHHGFQSGSAQAEIAGYDLIRPPVCLLPVSSLNAYTLFCAHKPSFRHLAEQDYVREMITGTPQRTIPLPYTPPTQARAELDRAYRAGRERCGATAWIYTELFTARQEDFHFTLLNTTHATATVWIELFFEHDKQRVRGIKATVPAGSLKTLCIVGNEVEPDVAPYFNWLSLTKQGIPENAPFAARFISDVPIVVSHKEHTASYRSSVEW